MLLRDGELHNDLDRPPPPIASVEWEGTWLPKTKTWKELKGSDFPEIEPGDCASDIGPVAVDGDYLPFLIAMRTIFEGELSASEKEQALRREMQKDRWSDFVRRHGGPEEVMRGLLGVRKRRVSHGKARRPR